MHSENNSGQPQQSHSPDVKLVLQFAVLSHPDSVALPSFRSLSTDTLLHKLCEREPVAPAIHQNHEMNGRMRPVDSSSIGRIADESPSRSLIVGPQFHAVPRILVYSADLSCLFPLKLPFPGGIEQWGLFPVLRCLPWFS